MDESTGAPTPMSGYAPQPIPTARLVLVPLGVEHAEEMAAVLADPALHTFIGGEPAGPPRCGPATNGWSPARPTRPSRGATGSSGSSDGGRLAGFVQATVTEPHEPVADAATAGARAVGHRHLDEAAPATAVPVAEIAWVVGTQWQGRGSPPRPPEGWPAGWGGAVCVPSWPTSIPTTARRRRWPRPAAWLRRTCGTTARSAGPDLPPRLPRPLGADQGVRVGDDVRSGYEPLINGEIWGGQKGASTDRRRTWVR
ncbi:hypothetical protein V2I01_36310 [Micromonospora sp. BRA006-A]|nr:hypothetical protein [Micromonospora sp. BRA006-A]